MRPMTATKSIQLGPFSARLIAQPAYSGQPVWLDALYHA